jgi:hypothetical protein
VRTALIFALAALAGCSGTPGKRVNVQDVMIYAPATVSGGAGLQMCVVPARRYDAPESVPAKKTMLVVPLTKADGTVGGSVLAGVLGFPVSFAVAPPFFLTLEDGFLHIDADKEKHTITASVEGAKNPGPAPVTAKDELWVWIGSEPSKDVPDPRGTFVGVRLAK